MSNGVSATVTGNVLTVGDQTIVLEHCFRHDGWSSPKIVTVIYDWKQSPEIGSTLTCSGDLSVDVTQLTGVHYVSQRI